MEIIVSKHPKAKEGKMVVKGTMITTASMTTTNDSRVPGNY